MEFLFSRSLTSKEFIIPLSSALRKNILFQSQNSMEKQQALITSTHIPAMGQFLAVRPKLIREEEYDSYIYEKTIFIMLLII